MYPWPEDNIDKTDDWGCLYTGVVIAVARADVTIQTLIYSCRCLYMWFTEPCMHLSRWTLSWEDGIHIVSRYSVLLLVIIGLHVVT